MAEEPDPPFDILNEATGRSSAGGTNMGNYKPCVDCGKTVVLGVRRGNICLDCLIIRMAEVLSPTKRKKFLKGVFQQEDIGPKAQEKPSEAPKDAGPGPS